MGWMDEYNALKKRKKKDDQKISSSPNSSSKSSSGSSWMDRYNELARLDAEEAEKKVYQSLGTVGSLSSSFVEEEPEEEKEKWYEGWFQKGASEESIGKAILGTLADVGEDLATGLVGIGEKAVDAIASIAPHAYNANIAINGGILSPEQRKMHDEVVKESEKAAGEFIAKDLYDENKVAKQILANVYGAANNAMKTQNGQQLTQEDIIQQRENTKTAQQYMDEKMEFDSVLASKSDSVVQSAGQLAGTAALSALGIPADVVIGLSAYGGEYENALKNGASYDEAALSSAVSAGAEILTEKISGGIKFGGKTLDDVGTKWLAGNVSNKLTRTLIKMGMETAGEGLEEVISGYASALGQKMTYMSEKELNELFTNEDKWEAFIGGAALGGFGSATQAVNAAASGVDSVTGLTKNEQKVVEKEFQNRLAEAEKDGKLSSSEKTKLHEKVVHDMEKGYISTDTIEEALGGEKYERYTKAKEWEDSIKKEYDELHKMKRGDMTGEQIDRETELKRMLDHIEQTSTTKQFREDIGKEVEELVKGDRLVESYNERARTKQRFEADLTQYDEKYQATFKRAIESGVLNNTNRSHELVEFAAKLEADKGYTIDFTNNKKIKETSFAVEGKIVNGYKTDSGIAINVQSPKYLESTIGHEITHVLEGTDFYDTLKETIFEYSKSKGEYDSRLKHLTELYKNIEDADVEAELAADLVGDYIFTDADFVNRLSTENRNIFEKIYDEIKYFCKIVTAGSEEARKLEEVKRVFEKAYRGDVKAKSGTDYSLEYIDNVPYVKAENTIFLKEDGTMASEKEVFDSLVGKTIHFPDGDVEIVSRLPGKSMRAELVHRRPAHSTGVDDMKQLNADVNYNMEELLTNSTTTETGLPDKGGKHAQQGITGFDTRAVNFYDGNKAYEIQFSIATLEDGKKVAYAKKYFKYNPKLTKKIQTAEARNKKSPLNQQSAIEDIVPEDGKKVNIQYSISEDTDRVFYTPRGVEVVKNPTSAEYRQMREDIYKEYPWLRGTGEAILRHTYDESGNEYYWSAYDGMHRDVEPYINKQYNTRTSQHWEWWTRPDKDDYPTDYSDIRYSLSEDSDGRKLSVNQAAYFEDSKMRNDDGSLMVMYHGTDDTNFTVFDPEFSDDKTSLFFTSDPEVANTYTKRQDYGRDVDPYNLITEDSTAEEFNSAQERIGGGMRVFQITEEWLQEMRNIAAEKSVQVVEQANKYADFLESSGTEAMQEIADSIRSIIADNPPFLSYVRARKIGSALFDSNQRAFFVKDRALSAKLREQEKAVRAVLEPYKSYCQAASLQDSSIGQYTYTETNSHNAFSIASKKFGFGGDVLTGSESAMVAKALDRSKWSEESDLGNRYKVYLNLVNPYVVDAGVDYSGRMSSVSLERGYYSDRWTVSFENAEFDESRYMTSFEFEEFIKSAFDAETLAVIKAQIEADNDAYLKEWGDLDTDEVNHSINLKDVDFKYVESGNWNNLYDSDVAEYFGKGENAALRTRDVAQYAKAHGYDGVIFKNMKDAGGYAAFKGRGGSTVAVAFNSSQVKSVDNFYPTHDKDMRYSLSEQGEAPYGRGTLGKDVSLEPIEDIAPAAENSTVPEKTQLAEENSTAAEMFPDEPNAESELEALYQERSELENRMLEMGEDSDPDEATQVSNRYGEVLARISELEGDDFYGADSFVDEDVPAETEDVSGELAPAQRYNPFDDRDALNIYKRNIKAFIHENPEFAELFRAEANIMMGELQRTDKGKRLYNDELYSRSGGEEGWMGQKRNTSESIEELLDAYGMSYGDIESGLRDILRGGDSVNSAAAKKIEFVINERLANGYTDFDTGKPVPANEDYLKMLDGYNANQVGQEDAESLGDADAPIEDEYLLPTQEVERLIAEDKDVSKVDGFVIERREVTRDGETYYTYAIRTPDKQVIRGRTELDKAAFFNKTMEEIDLYKSGKHPIGKHFQKFAADANDDFAPVYEDVGVDDVPAVPTNPGDKPSIFPDKRTDSSPAGHIAKILPSKEVEKRKKFKAWEWAKEHLLDNGMVFEDLSKETGNRALEEKWDFIRKANSRGQHLIGKGAGSVKALKDIRQTVLDSGKYDDFVDYMYHKHNVDRMSLRERGLGQNKPVFGYPVTWHHSSDEVLKYEANNPEFVEWAQDIYDYNTHLRDLLVESGYISQETSDLWEYMYPHYVPIRRDGKGGFTFKKDKSTGGSPLKGATGGSANIVDLFDTMGEKTMQYFRMMARNDFGVELKNTLQTQLESDSPTLEELLSIFDTDASLLKPGENGLNPTFTVFENGQRVDFQITEEMYEALKPKSAAMQYRAPYVSAWSELFRKATTEYNPAFMLTNPIKDTQDILLNSQHPAETYMHLPGAFWQSFTHRGDWYQEYVENGGEQNSYFDNETIQFKGDTKNPVKKFLNGVSWLNNAIEMTPRLAEYIASRSEGKSIQGAMLDASRVTTNFSAGGDVAKFANRNGATFLNASIQGAVQQVRNVREAHHKGVLGYVGLMARMVVAGLPAVLLNGYWDDDEDYEQLADYVKENYYIVHKTDDGRFIRIPKGRAVAVIQDAVDKVMSVASGDEEADFATFLELAWDNLKLAAENVAPNNPFDNNILAPIFQVARNQTWYDEDIVPSRLQNLPAAEQFDEKTDRFSVGVGELFNVSPKKVNYLLNQYSGGLGDMILPMMTPKAESPDDSFGSGLLAPVRDKFVTDPVLNNQVVSDFWSKQEELTVKANAKDATTEDKMMAEYIDTISYEVNDLYAQKREIQMSDRPNSEKYELTKQLQQQINEAMEEALSSYQDVKVDGMYCEVGNRRYNYDSAKDTWYEIRKHNADGSDNYYYQQERKAIQVFGIKSADYWNNRDAYNDALYYATSYGKNLVKTASKVFGVTEFAGYGKDLSCLKADYDSKGNAISGSKKDKVIDYCNSMDADYGEKIILFKSQYPKDNTYNDDIIDYLNERDDLTYNDRKTILEELGFRIGSDGRVYWD